MAREDGRRGLARPEAGFWGLIPNCVRGLFGVAAGFRWRPHRRNACAVNPARLGRKRIFPAKIPRQAVMSLRPGLWSPVQSSRTYLQKLTASGNFVGNRGGGFRVSGKGARGNPQAVGIPKASLTSRLIKRQPCGRWQVRASAGAGATAAPAIIHHHHR